MTPQEFLDEFGTLANAESGVQKLRQLVLDLAMAGRLVPRKTDESSNWDVVNLQSVTTIVRGSSPRPKGDPNYFGGPVPRLLIADITRDGKHVTPQIDSLTEAGAKLSRPMPSGALVVSISGSYGIPAFLAVDACIHDGFIGFRQVAPTVDPEFLFLVLRWRKPYFDDVVKDSGLKNLTTTHLKELRLPVPMLAEQHRIVAKVDELMRLCDGLEAVQKQRRGVRLRLNRSSLDRLTVVQSPAQVSAAWQRVCDHFEVLYDTPETRPDLRQTILQLAVQGKLVKQDPNDEPAAELLERVACEKRNRIEQKKMKQQWAFNQIKDTDAPFDLASGWQWSRIIDAVERVTVGHVGSMRTQYVSEGVPFLRCQNVRENRFDPLGLEFISAEFHEQLAKSRLEPRDVVVVRTGAMVGMTCVIPNSLEDANCSDLVIIKQPMALISEYVSFFMNLMAKRNSEEQVVGIAIPHFNTKSVAALPIPVPPLPEQKRIVSKVTDLLSQVTRLESTLTRREATRTQLLTAAIHSLLNPEASS